MKPKRSFSVNSNPPPLENQSLRLDIDQEQGALRTLHNHLTGETFAISADSFELELDGVTLRSSEFLEVSASSGDTHERCFRFSHPLATVEMRYVLGPGHQFAERHLAVTFTRDVTLRRVTVGALTFRGVDGGAVEAARLSLACYRYPDFQWATASARAKHEFGLQRPADSEPNRTFFCRTGTGGVFTGIEMPFDDSTLDDRTVRLGFAANLIVKAGELLRLGAMYIGVYRLRKRDARAAEWRPWPGLLGRIAQASGRESERASAPPLILPLPSESAAMVAMTSAILGPPRHGLKAFACGWHCQMRKTEYESDAAVRGESRSLEFMAECGLDGLMDSHPWGGETAAMAGLREADRYAPGPRVRRFLGRARELGLAVVQWPTMNNTHPWIEDGKPFRLDRPEWLRGVEADLRAGANAEDFRRQKANCLGCAPFLRWLARTIIDDALGTGLYEGWCMDGDFWGSGANLDTTIPVTCLADGHDHARGDSTCACQRALDGLVAEVRRRRPGIYVIMCRPAMDLGVWALRNVDACFTLVESGTSGSNIVGGDEIRTASRIRVHHQFCPHWLDQSLLFPSYADPEHVPAWPNRHIDYIMLSALSCSPNLLFYLPTRTGIPSADKAEIRKWLTWGRRNTEYLLVRQDLFDWPELGRVDGSAHIVGHHGLIFLFNPGRTTGLAEFSLTPECVGFTGRTQVEVRQEHPSSDSHALHAPGDMVRWPVPAETAVVLRVSPRKDKL